jgi:glutamate-1-semialdehyde 2,1-aminomutase
MAGAHSTLAVLSENGGAALQQAHAMGGVLMDGIRERARKRGVPLLVTGFPTAFALHFTHRDVLRNYRDTFDDDIALLSRFVKLLLTEGVYILPDGRMYTSVVHGDREVEETLAAFARAIEHVN